MDNPEQATLFDFDKPDIKELPSDEELKQIIKARWLSCVCDKYARPQDWLKASEFLGKAIGAFVEKAEVTTQERELTTLTDSELERIASGGG
jgi:hypothetical protein